VERIEHVLSTPEAFAGIWRRSILNGGAIAEVR